MFAPEPNDSDDVVPQLLVAYTTAITEQPQVRLNGACVNTDYGIVQLRAEIVAALAPLQLVVVAHVPVIVLIIIVQFKIGAPIIGAVQVITMFVPELTVTGVPGADGDTYTVVLVQYVELQLYDTDVLQL